MSSNFSQFRLAPDSRLFKLHREIAILAEDDDGSLGKLFNVQHSSNLSGYEQYQFSMGVEGS